MEDSVDLWILNNTIDDNKLIKYVSDTPHNVSYLLDLNKNKYTLIEKVIYDIAMFHFKRLNIHNTENHYVEFWCKSVFDTQLDIDCHQYTKHTEDFIYPTLSCVTYLNDVSNSPTILTNINHDSYKYKMFNEQTEIILSFPKLNKHISFDGNLYSNATAFDTQDTCNRYTISINIWDVRPKSIHYYDDIISDSNLDANSSYMANNSIIYINPDNMPIDNIKVCDSVINYKLFNDILYTNNPRAFHKFTKLIKQYHTDHNGDINTIKFVFDNSIKEFELETKHRTKYGNIIDDIKQIKNFNTCNLIIHNRFLQRFTFPNIYTNDMCAYIIKESNNYNRCFSYMPIDNITSIFGLIIESSNTILRKIKTAYGIHNDINVNIIDLFIEKQIPKGDNVDKSIVDKSHILFSILLNSRNEFEGGGRYFEDGITTNMERGDILIHCSNIKYRELPITKGQRYLLTGVTNIIL